MYRIIFLSALIVWSVTLNAQNTLYDLREDKEFREGMELLHKEKYAAARQTFESYLRSNPKGINKEEALYYRAYSALNLYHIDAEELFEEFIHKYGYHPKAALAYYELGDFYFKDKQYEKSINYFEQVPLSKVNPQQQLETRFKLAYGYFGQKRFNEALTKFNQIKVAPSKYSAAASYYAGYIEYRNGDYEQALTDLKRAEQSPSYAPLVPYMVANVYYQQKRFDELLDYTEEVLPRKDIRNANEIYLLAGEAYYFKGDYQKAAEHFNNYASRVGKKPQKDIQYKLAYAQYVSGDEAGALENFKALASRDEEIGQFSSYYLGEIYLKQDNLKYAATSLQKARTDTYNDEIKEAATFKYAKVQYDLHNYPQAIEVLEAFLQEYPQSRYRQEADDLVSEAYLHTNNYTQAITHLESIPDKSERAQKAYQKVTYFKGTEYFNNGKYRNAVSMFDRSLKYPYDKEMVVLANFWSAEAYSIGKRYPQAIDHYNTVFRESSEQHDKHIKARYGVGYAYFNTQRYDQALGQFSQYAQVARSNRDKYFYDDALMRIADCNYVLKDYNKAVSSYDQAIARNSGDADYAYYQKGLILGIQGKTQAAKENFRTVVRKYPQSRFVDNAIFQSAQLDLEGGKYQSAINGFSQLINGYGKSSLVPVAHTKRAIAYYNQQNYQATIDDYKLVLDRYINHESANDALIGLQEALNQVGRSSEFDTYLARYKQANPENESLANIEYESAKNLYLNEDYPGAVQKLEAFMKAYPDHPSVYEARYYTAESFYRMNQDAQAMRYYDKVIEDNRISQVKRAMRRMGDILADQGDYTEAIAYYQQLEAAASTKKDQYYAWSGLMVSHYEVGNYQQVEQYARLILDQGSVSTNARNQSLLYMGKAAYQRKDYAAATDHFLNTLNTAQDEYGAEAQYMLAKIQHEQQQYQSSNETLYDLNNKFGAYETWLGRSFLLIAENYIGLEEIFQAKATLKSIIENAPPGEIVDKAKRRLGQLEESYPETDENSSNEETDNGEPRR